ncbi:MAG: Cof-type HAD-IIB family hydrolase [Treponema sp.]|nr:Cof-type HAD-IIB family hydrolase [Treponema sp.]
MTKLPEGKLDARIIALDLDDTLLNKDLQITPLTVDALRECARRGIYVVMCSGRAENAILPYVRQLEIAGMQAGRYIIAMNGAIIYDMHTRSVIYSRTVSGEILLETYRMASKHDLPCQVYDASTIYPSCDNRWTRRDVELSGLAMKVVDDFEAFIAPGHCKMVIPGDPDKVSVLQDELKAAFGDRAVVFTSKPYFLEVLPPKSGKGEALLYLAEQLGIPQANTMAFGDSMNDESMIRGAAMSVAMVNGLPYIHEAARYITRTDNNHDGVGDFLWEYVL